MKEKDVNFESWYEIACLPDDFRSLEFTLFEGWHYSRFPIYDGINPSDANYSSHRQHNATYALGQALNVFKGKDPLFYKSLMARLFIHIMGDIHQPLHMATRFTSTRKNGDEGGKLFKIRGPITNLYDLWGRAMGKITEVKRVVLFCEY